ncbi:uncharacterized protein LOC131428663 [Malaya genurostris]|uniref:uncharacterized protein LOC131428663 n=1 Tax=Malaya genurostris TaxID=325434 RepID=UPI0026F40511|nr:uncharacterized protein LOC131428663 [Malaya genurostris]
MTTDVSVDPNRSWINVDYFTQVLEKYFGIDVVVISYYVEDGSPKGQNFMSSIIRATVTYCRCDDEWCTISLILKTGLPNPELARNVQYVLAIEKDIYGPVMRGIRDLLTSFGDYSRFAPKMFYEDINALVLEDLAVKGYTQPDRKTRLDMRHCKLLIRKIAKFHAATAVLGRKNRQLFQLHMTSGFLDQTNAIRLFYLNCISECISLTETVPELSDYRDFLCNFSKTMIERECDTFSREENGFNVLNHGDLWQNNALWQYDKEGNLQDVLLLDYQECFFGSPGIDLNQFLYSSANNDVQLNGFDDLIEIYVSELQSTLKMLEYDSDIPTFDTILNEMRKKRDHAVVVTTCMVPALIIEVPELATPENMLEDSDQARRARREVFSNPRFIEILKILLPRLAGDCENGSNEHSILDTEVRMYSEVLPAMMKTLGDVGESIDFPRLIHASPKPNTILILENVHPMGWLSFKKYRSTYEDVSATIQTIAKFHALSYYLNETSIDLSTFKSTMTKETENKDQITDSFTSFANHVGTWTDCEQLASKLQTLKTTVQEKRNLLHKPNSKSHGYNVLNHGAIHPKNLFYKVNSTGLVTKTMLIDFQRCHWGSPAIDLLCLLDLVVKHDVKLTKRNEIIYQYYQHFVNTLNKIGFLGTVPSLVDLHIELLRKGLFGTLVDTLIIGTLTAVCCTTSPNRNLLAMETNNIIEKYSYITREYLEDVLRKEQCESAINVKDFSVVMALAKGENYSSDILRVKVNYVTGSNNHRTQTYIIKSQVITEGMADILEEYDVFHREIAVYNNVMPKVEQILAEIGYTNKLAPIAHMIGKTNPKHFIFEDLTQYGFRSADRKQGLNYHQLEMVLEKVAKFHAATAVLYSRDEQTMKDHHYRNINEDVQHFYSLFQNSMVSCAEQAQNWASTPKCITEKVFNLEKTVISKGCQVYTRDDSTFNVLNHGDLWVNNIMYKFDGRGNPIDCILVDYAVGFFGSPAIDLSYLLFTSSSDDVTTDQFDLLLQHYHSELVDCLTKLGYSKKMPTLIDIQVEMLRKGFAGIMFVTFLIPLRLNEDTANADLGNLLGSSEEAIQFRRNMFSHPKYKGRMEYLLKYFDRKGYLD